MQTLSIIVPTRNEKDNIRELVERLHAALSLQDIPYEIIFVDDNSTDETQNIIKTLSKNYSITLKIKKGKKGKSQSLIEGFSYAKHDLICMIDADLQYPPEAIPEMIDAINKGAEIVVADRKIYQSSRLRKFLSTSFRNIFGKYLFGLNQDVQSGLKLFKREVLDTISFNPKSGWVFDLEFLHRANQAGFTIENHEITFQERNAGESKVSFLKTSFEIGIDALFLKTKKIKPIVIQAQTKESMQGAGIRFKQNKYITHTTLHHSQSAIETFLNKQKFFLMFLLTLFAFGIFWKPLFALQIAVGILSFIYFVDVLFNFFLIIKSLHFPHEITFNEKELDKLDETSLPIYSILCPLYKEAHIIPHFLNSIDKIDYPKDKLDVMLLLEEDDKESREAVRQMNLPEYVRVLIVPDSLPKTKPKACNYGLAHAKGEYLVIYDAEDMPDPLQLKKAYQGFQKVGKDVVCLQAKLNYYNPHQNLLTRFFTAEYSLWFDVTLTGLQGFNTSLPLGGTSNHFRTADLHALQGWDPFNVTEDADLGIRLFKKGFKTAIIDSVTLEEANSKWGNWLRQRSRWIKGYMQTYLVHTRELFGLKGKKKRHALIFHLVIGGKIAFILINPFLWLATISYFALYAFVGPTIEALYPSIVFYMAVTSLIFGNFLFIYYYMIGCVKREQWTLIKFVYLVPFYWIMISAAGFIALYQLLFKPHYWEKTLHGLHLKNDFKKIIPEAVIAGEEAPFGIKIPRLVRLSFLRRIKNKQLYLAGMLLIVAQGGTNFLNFLFNAYLGRVLDYDDFAAINLFSVLFSLAAIVFNGISGSVNYKSGFLETRYGKKAATAFLAKTTKQAIIYASVSSVLWILISPLLVNYFKLDSLIPFLLFTPIWLAGFVGYVNTGFLAGKLLFGYLAFLLFFEAVLKLLFAYGLVHLGLDTATYAAIPLAAIFTLFFGWIFVQKKKEPNINDVSKRILSYPKKFFLASMLSGLSITAYMSIDVILAKHFLTSVAAGEYALISLVGKMVFFLSSLSNQFILPLVSRKEGDNKDSSTILRGILLATFGLTFSGFLVFGLASQFTIPFLLGAKTQSILQYLPIFALGVMYFAMGRVFISYYLPKKIYSFSIAGFLITLLEFILISLYHRSIQDIVYIATFTGIFNFFFVLLLHLNISSVKIFESNIKDFFGLFSRNISTNASDKPSILIFNWRDIKHIWAGGAEVYIHELAKRWVKEGNKVTIFCGNDGKSPRYETIDGIEIIRRGGFYFVYIWAFLYYILRLRNKYDIIIDCENGVPFFTPLYARKKVYLLIHHVHQEVFRKSLHPIFSWIAQVIELKLMPFIYKNTQVITVSPSSKDEILRHKLTKEEPIIIYNGVDLTRFMPKRRQKNPLILYLGRLQYYKSLPVFIHAAKIILQEVPDAEFVIAGEGEQKKYLQNLAKDLGIASHITFTGKVSEEEKVKLFQKAWVFVNPSMMEGWGITTIEANACGTPAVASNVPGLKNSINDNITGLLVEYGNVPQFSQAILRIIKNNYLRKKLSKNAVMWAKEFDWNKSAEISLNIFLQEQKLHAINENIEFAKSYEK